MQDVTKVVGLALNVAMIGIALALGLRSRWPDVSYFFRDQGLLAKTILARNVLVPAAAIALVLSFHLDRVVAATLLVASVTALPPLLPKAELRAGVRDFYSTGLLASQTMLAMVFVPATLAFMSFVLGAQASFSAAQVAGVVSRTLVLPFAIGLLMREIVPRFSNAIGPRVERLSELTVLAGAAAIVALAWKPMLSHIGGGTLAAMTLLSLAGLAAGHLLGGPREETRSALALAAASSHPGLAMAVVAANAPDQKQGALAALLLYLIVGAIVKGAYTARRRGVVDRMKRGLGDRRHTARLSPERRHVIG